ncbi:hypothetical protein L686_04880 [Stutzerimonas stutzeri MF28]|nr:hypothetical protein L686_04880 [Stutzerimonas stutzeri MF28]
MKRICFLILPNTFKCCIFFYGMNIRNCNSIMKLDKIKTSSFILPCYIYRFFIFFINIPASNITADELKTHGDFLACDGSVVVYYFAYRDFFCQASMTSCY